MKQRCCTIGHDDYRLEEYKRVQGQDRFDFMRIKNDGLPPAVKPSEQAENLDLDEDTGLGYSTAAVLDMRWGVPVLAVQRNRSGVSAKNITTYVQRMVDTEQPIDLNPILLPRGYARLTGLRRVKRVELKVAKVLPDTVTDAETQTWKRRSALIDEFGANFEHLIWTMGREKEKGIQIKRLWSWLKKKGINPEEPDSTVLMIRVEGTTEDNEPDAIDLLTDRMVQPEYVEVHRNAASWSDRIAAVRRALDHQAKNLKDLFQGK